MSTDLLTSARRVAESVRDPELPMLTLAELGVLRDVKQDGDLIVITITPTYSGCPALTEMREDLRRRLGEEGHEHVEVRTVLDPPWSSGDISAAGRRKLVEAGIAPPQPVRRSDGPIPLTLHVNRQLQCPRCGTTSTSQLSAFSATACKALYRCRDCGEPFEYFKEI